ncbi:hypothetical protein [Lentzea flava]|uniref:hypothetical protein n=1 Tax=Lentzea flava TaxID=103732 RepID=UPI0016711489|nr:hypothetical protein [Lentzea flava]
MTAQASTTAKFLYLIISGVVFRAMTLTSAGSGGCSVACLLSPLIRIAAVTPPATSTAAAKITTTISPVHLFFGRRVFLPVRGSYRNCHGLPAGTELRVTWNQPGVVFVQPQVRLTRALVACEAGPNRYQPYGGRTS